MKTHKHENTKTRANLHILMSRPVHLVNLVPRFTYNMETIDHGENLSHHHQSTIIILTTNHLSLGIWDSEEILLGEAKAL